MSEFGIIISTIVILALGFFQIAINSKKHKRVTQLPVVVFAVFVMILGIILFMYKGRDTAKTTYTDEQNYSSTDTVNEDDETDSKDDGKKFYFGADPNEEKEDAEEEEDGENVSAEEEDVKSLYNGSEVFLANAVLLLAYCIIRIPVFLLCSKSIKSNESLKALALNLYEHDDWYDKWFLKKECVNFRRFFFAVTIALNLATGIFLGLTWMLGPESKLWLFAFPCAALAIVTEIYNYINGQTKEEYEHSIIGDASDSRRISNYYKLREIYENILPAPILSAHTGFEFARSETAADILKKMSKSDDELDNITASYFNLSERYKTAEPDYVQATQKMMHRNNVMFFNPFYKDLKMYITLPMTYALLSGKKCTVICGRNSVVEDVKSWLTELLSEYSHMESLWRVAVLNDRKPECEVGIITFTGIYDKKVLQENKDFFNETDFVFVIEPSVMLNTSQIALTILAGAMSENDEYPVYCICDRQTDGLVDTLSHLLRTEITNVVAPPVPRCNYTEMSWNADGDFSRQQLFNKQTGYLGNGTELAAIAVKNQVPKVSWYGEEKAPLKDIKWLTGQYYSTLCRYMNLPSQQKNLYETVEFVPNLWSSGKAKEKFIIVEDEFCNMFNMMRTFLSRGKNQVFVNVLSESYLLRDYMRCNKTMFMSNPNAIPSMVPDYAKTERNTLLKLLLMMSLRPVSEEEIAKEFNIIGIETRDILDTLSKLLAKYTLADNSIFTLKSVRTMLDDFTSVPSCEYRISEGAFDAYFSESLKNAYYIVEDEKDEEEFIDAKMFGHVIQTVLPGQMLTCDGKSYIARRISPQSGVVLHRASNLYDGRKYYRQIRKYTLKDDLNEIVSIRTVGDIEFTEIRKNIRVETTGYLDMKENHDLRTAKVVDFSEDPNAVCYTREYRNKTLLCIKLPDSDERIRFTICMMLSELFRTVFPKGWQYIAVVAKRPDDIDGMLNYMVYESDGDIKDDYIYVIEDSDIDLGLISAVEKNFTRFMEIIADFLEWHIEKMREPASNDPIPEKIAVKIKEEEKKRGLFTRMLDRILKIFGADKRDKVKKPEKNEGKSAAATEETQTTDTTDTTEDSGYTLVEDEANINKADEPNVKDTETEAIDCSGGDESSSASSYDGKKTGDWEDFRTDGNDNPDIEDVDGTDIFENDGMPEDNEYFEDIFRAAGIFKTEKSRYQMECFLKFGYEEIDSRIRIEDLRKYLRVRGWTNNSLTRARAEDELEVTAVDVATVNRCDFCGLPLTGVSYERLNDGRIRCNDCSSSAITDVDEFRELFFNCLELMGDFYDIQFRAPINAKMTDARTIAKGAGRIFRPSTEYAARVLGYAQLKKGVYNVFIENGSPRLASTSTLVHELTHIWQYLNWNDRVITQIYGMNCPSCTALAKEIVYEGMAMWAAIQYLYLIGETYYAAREEAETLARKDVYGLGFALYCERYPLVKESAILKYSPFAYFPPLEPADVCGAVKAVCTADECIC